MTNENAELLRRLDAWQEGEAAGPLIRWAAAVLRDDDDDDVLWAETEGLFMNAKGPLPEDMGTGWSQGPTTTAKASEPPDPGKPESGTDGTRLSKQGRAGLGCIAIPILAVALGLLTVWGGQYLDLWQIGVVLLGILTAGILTWMYWDHDYWDRKS